MPLSGSSIFISSICNDIISNWSWTSGWDMSVIKRDSCWIKLKRNRSSRLTWNDSFTPSSKYIYCYIIGRKVSHLHNQTHLMPSPSTKFLWSGCLILENPDTTSWNEHKSGCGGGLFFLKCSCSSFSLKFIGDHYLATPNSTGCFKIGPDDSQ